MTPKPAELFVIDPSIIRPEKESFQLLQDLSPRPLSLHLPGLEGMQSLHEREKSKRCVGAIILGSAAGVHENRPWQKELVEWIQSKMGPQFPILGICFGHQLLAYMHGSPVGPCQEKQLGFRNVQIFEDQRLGFASFEVPLFVSHNDEVHEIPKSFELFAQSPTIAIEGLRHKDFPIWTLQSHIDATGPFALNSFYTDEKQFPLLSKGNQILKVFLDRFAQFSKSSE